MQRARHSIMRLRSMAIIGLAGYAFLRHRRTKRRAQDTTLDDFAIDPLDSVQSFEKISDLEVAELDVDALTAQDIAAAEDLAVLETGSELESEESQTDPDEQLILVGTADDVIALDAPSRRDEHPDDDRAFDEGQNWIEALETSAIENGAEPERSLDDIIDDEDVLQPPHASDRRDRPVADQGSGGRRGL
jgi:hypothetical protein